VNAGQVHLDLNHREFQGDLFGLAKENQRSVMTTLGKLSVMTWDQVYRDPGLRWEAIVSVRGPNGGRLYSLRVGKGFRAVAFRDGDWLRLLALHPGHDSAYE
jgi:hypothetical protein